MFSISNEVVLYIQIYNCIKGTSALFTGLRWIRGSDDRWGCHVTKQSEQSSFPGISRHPQNQPIKSPVPGVTSYATRGQRSKETGHIPQEGATSGHRRLTKIRSLKVKVVIGPLLPTPVTEAVPDDLAGGEIHVL